MAPKKPAAAKKAKKAPTKTKKAAKSKTTVPAKLVKNQNKAPVKPKAPPARPVNSRDVPLEKLVEYMTEGMKRVGVRLNADIPKMLDPKRPASELAHLFGMTRELSTICGEALKPISDANGLLANVMIPKAFEDANIKSFTTQDGYRVTVSVTFRASIKGDKKAEAYDWLRDNGLGELITETVNAGTLGAAGKAMIEEKGTELPEELFNAAYMPSASLTKVAKK